LGRLLLLVAAAAGIGWYAAGHAHAQRQEQRLGAIASVLAGRKVGVHCQSLGRELIDVTAEDGEVEFDGLGHPADHTDLKRRICKALARFPRDLVTPAFGCVDAGTPCTKRVRDDVWAAHVLAHESSHLAGQATEEVAECTAVQTTAFVARELGADAKRAQAIASYAWTYLYKTTPDSYQSADCRNGGKLDLRRGDPVWP
jgi:hypothetical protein